MVDFLKIWGTLIIALFALIQPWILAIWKKVSWQQEVDVFETGSIEIGFSSYGPTVGLQGTLRSVHNDAFISSIKLHVVREKDRLQHTLDWGVFRSSAFPFNTNDASFELCRSFLLSQQFPSTYNIQFWDRDTQNELGPLLEQTRSAWTNRCMTQGWQEIMKKVADAAGGADELHQLTRSLYSEFSKEKLHVDVYSAIQRLFYWEPGDYTLDMIVTTSRPRHKYKRRWKFELLAKDADSLRCNIIAAVDEACSQQQFNYSFAYPHYIDHEE